MGRVKGKAKKQSINAVRYDAGSGEEENIPIRRRGRPQKPLKDDIVQEEEEVVKIEDEESEGAKSSVLNKDVQKQTTAENGRKRKRNSQSKENPDSVKVENNAGKKTDELKAVGFRQNGSRRKNSKPHRAAEVGVECIC